MNNTMRWIVGGVLGAAAVAAGAAALSATAFAAAPSGPAGDSDVSITGDALATASAAALAAVGGGTVTQTEVGDEESYYEVEVTFANGHQVDVQLDENFALVTTIPDGDGG